MSPDELLTQQFHTFSKSSWRWECQGDYRIDAAKLERWRQGLPSDTASKQPWLRYIRDLVEQGKTFERVRMLTEPLTEYLQWLIEQTETNVDAGEGIRWVGQGAAADLGMPKYDFYLFDDTRLAIMRFDDGKLLADLDIVTDPAIVAQHRAFRDAVWPVATPHAEFTALRGS